MCGFNNFTLQCLLVWTKYNSPMMSRVDLKEKYYSDNVLKLFQVRKKSGNIFVYFNVTCFSPLHKFFSFVMWVPLRFLLKPTNRKQRSYFIFKNTFKIFMQNSKQTLWYVVKILPLQSSSCHICDHNNQNIDMGLEMCVLFSSAGLFSMNSSIVCRFYWFTVNDIKCPR